MCLFTNIFYVKKKTAKPRVGASKSKRRVMKFCNSLLNNENKIKGNSKINDQIKRNLYAWKKRHPQVVQSPISNYCLIAH